MYLAIDKNLALVGHILSKNNDEKNLKTYIHWQSTISSKKLKRKPKNKQNITSPQKSKTNV